MFFFELYCVEGPKVIYPKHYKNSNESCTFAVFWPIGLEGKYCNFAKVSFEGFLFYFQRQKIYKIILFVHCRICSKKVH